MYISLVSIAYSMVMLIPIYVHVFQVVFFLHIFHLVVCTHWSPFVPVRLVVRDFIALIIFDNA